MDERIRKIIVPILICVVFVSTVVLVTVIINRRKDTENGNARRIYVSYGDSITMQGGFQNQAAGEFNLTHRNCGGNGTTVTDGVRPSSTHPAMSQNQRLTEIESHNPDIITIFGGMNDMTYHSPIGTADNITDKDCTTFIGAYSHIIEHLRAWKPTIKILAIVTYDRFLPDTNTEHQEALQSATRLVIEHYGLDYIDADTMFTPENKAEYILNDGLHMTTAGRGKLAAEIVRKFRTML